MNRPDNGWPIMSQPRTRLYVGVPVEVTYKRDSWSCQCMRPDGLRLLRNKRHTAPELCLSQAQIDAWRQRMKATCSERIARSLAWLASEFGHV